jgi:hypothetical protein
MKSIFLVETTDPGPQNHRFGDLHVELSVELPNQLFGWSGPLPITVTVPKGQPPIIVRGFKIRVSTRSKEGFDLRDMSYSADQPLEHRVGPGESFSTNIISHWPSKPLPGTGYYVVFLLPMERLDKPGEILDNSQIMLTLT